MVHQFKTILEIKCKIIIRVESFRIQKNKTNICFEKLHIFHPLIRESTILLPLLLLLSLIRFLKQTLFVRSFFFSLFLYLMIQSQVSSFQIFNGFSYRWFNFTYFYLKVMYCRIFSKSVHIVEYFDNFSLKKEPKIMGKMAITDKNSGCGQTIPIDVRSCCWRYLRAEDKNSSLKTISKASVLYGQGLYFGVYFSGDVFLKPSSLCLIPKKQRLPSKNCDTKRYQTDKRWNSPH